MAALQYISALIHNLQYSTCLSVSNNHICQAQGAITDLIGMLTALIASLYLGSLQVNAHAHLQLLYEFSEMTNCDMY